MAEVKWIKIVTDIFDDEKMLLIESIPSADSIIVIWFKLLCLSGKNNNSGVFLMNERIPYTDEMLATIFRRDISIIRLALTTFEQFEMIEIINNVITIPNWEKHQTLDAYEKKKARDRMYQQQRREKQKLLVGDNKSSDTSTDISTDNSSDVAVSDIEEDIDIDIEEERDIDNSTTTVVSSTKVQPIIEKWNSLGLQKLVSINKGTSRYTMLQARIKEYGIENILKAMDNISTSSFLKGQNKRGWTINFEWFVRPNNFLKVLEGNYAEREVAKETNKPKGTSGFNNFKAREYDYDSLEADLLKWNEED